MNDKIITITVKQGEKAINDEAGILTVFNALSIEACNKIIAKFKIKESVEERLEDNAD